MCPIQVVRLLMVQVKFSSWVSLDLLPHICLRIPYLVPNIHISSIFVLASLS